MTTTPPSRSSWSVVQVVAVASGAFGALTAALSIGKDFGWLAVATIVLLCIYFASVVAVVRANRKGIFRPAFIVVGVLVLGGGGAWLVELAPVGAGTKSEKPVKITVADYPSDVCDGGDGYIYRKPISEVPLPLFSGQTESPDEIAKSSGGIPASPYKVLLRVTSGSQPGAVVNNIRVVVVKRVAASPGVHAYYSGGCGGGPIEPIQMRFNLDSHFSSDQVSPRDSAGRAIFPRKVPQGDPDAYDVVISADEGDYFFDVVVDWQSASTSGSDTFDNSGNHYRIASTRETSHFDGSSGSWVATRVALPVWFTGNH